MAEFSQNYDGEHYGTGYSRAKDPIVKLNLLDEDEVDAFFEQECPKYVIHSVAERRPDVSEKDLDGTWSLNVNSTQHLARLCKKYGSWLLTFRQTTSSMGHRHLTNQEILPTHSIYMAKVSGEKKRYRKSSITIVSYEFQSFMEKWKHLRSLQ